MNDVDDVQYSVDDLLADLNVAGNVAGNEGPTQCKRTKEEVVQQESFARSIGANTVVYSRKEDVHDTMIIRVLSGKEKFRAFGIKGKENIQSLFALVLLLIDQNKHYLKDARFDLKSKMQKIIDMVDQRGTITVNSQKSKLNSFFDKTITCGNIKLIFKCDGKHPQMALLTVDVETEKVIAGVYLFMWEVEKMLRYMMERFDLVKGYGNNYKNTFVNCDNDNFF